MNHLVKQMQDNKLVPTPTLVVTDGCFQPQKKKKNRGDPRALRMNHPSAWMNQHEPDEDIRLS